MGGGQGGCWSSPSASDDPLQSPPAPRCPLQLTLLIPFDCCTLLKKKKKGLKFEEDVEEPSLVVSYALWLQSTEKA